MRVALDETLNKEVEIIEDNKKIRKLSYFDDNACTFIQKINELVDKVNMIEENMDHIPRID